MKRSREFKGSLTTILQYIMDINKELNIINDICIDSEDDYNSLENISNYIEESLDPAFDDLKNNIEQIKDLLIEKISLS